MRTQEFDFGDVIALTLIDASSLTAGRVDPQTRVRIGVRRAETNPTHPHIVSVPTQRIPRALAEALLHHAESIEGLDQAVLIHAPRVSNRDRNGHDPVIYAVESLLCTKLGVADPLEEGRIQFDAVPAIYTVSYARYPNLFDVEASPYPPRELLRMINVRVEVTKGAGLFPEKTQSYDHGRWVPAKDFVKMMDGKDVSLVGLPGFQFCVDGLCITTTNQLIAKELAEARLS
jgi:hypothetical protein